MWLPPEPLKSIGKKQTRERVARLRLRLLRQQHELRERDFPVLVVFGGVDGAGKHETVNRLNAWLDPRFLCTLAYGEPSQEEAERPRMWRYWRDLPVRGQIGLVLSGWYSQPLVEYARHRSDATRFAHQLRQIKDFERMLTDDGALIIKFWMHLSARQQHRRLTELAEDPMSLWQIKPRDWEHLHLYDRFVGAAEQLLDATHCRNAPWHCIDGSAEGLRALIAAERLSDALARRLKARPAPRGRKLRPARGQGLAQADLEQRLTREKYADRLAVAQARLLRLQQTSLHSGRATLLVFEGWDAAGKGGAIRRLVQPLDARLYSLHPIAAPNDEERARHYLWRFWRRLPRAGHLCVFDRSWYGRVLVERVEGYASKAQWQRAYAEINAFEEALTESGIRLLKFWIHISQQEQLARFQAREGDPLKSWKLTEEDWRNRHKWEDYEAAVEDMLAHTHRPMAPWVVIPGNDKRLARVSVLEAACRTMAGH